MGLQVQCGFARAVIYQFGRSFFEAAKERKEKKVYTKIGAQKNTKFYFKFAIGIVNLTTQASYYWTFRFGFLTIMFYVHSVGRAIMWAVIAALIIFEVVALATQHCICNADTVMNGGFIEMRAGSAMRTLEEGGLIGFQQGGANFPDPSNIFTTDHNEWTTP